MTYNLDPRECRVLDASCGTGLVGQELTQYKKFIVAAVQILITEYIFWKLSLN